MVFEKLAEQLREPLFRSADSGYDPLDVRAFFDEVAARLAVLESRVAKAEARADKAERRLASARRFVRANGGGASLSDPGVLDDVVMAGQRQAEDVVAAAEMEAVRLREEGVARAAAARASVDDGPMRTRVDEARAGLRGVQDLCRRHEDDLEDVDRAVRAGRHELLSGLDRELAELAAMPFLHAKEARS